MQNEPKPAATQVLISVNDKLRVFVTGNSSASGSFPFIAKFRMLAKDAHPDLGGTKEAFDLLCKARDEALSQ